MLPDLLRPDHFVPEVLTLAQTGPDTDAIEEAVPDSLTAADWAEAGILFVAAVLLAAVIRKLLDRAMDRMPNGPTQLFRRLGTAVIVVVGFLYALSSIGVEVGLFLGALGIGGIALAFAFQDLLENFVAGVILQIKRPFRRGAWVEIGEQRLFGVVNNVDSRSVIIDTFAGDRIVLPAAEVLKNPIVNWTTRGRHRLAVPIDIHYRHDPADAIAAVEPRLSVIDEVLDEPAPRVLLSELGPTAVRITAYVWHDAFADIFWVQHRVIEEAKRGLEDAGVEIPFPQYVVALGTDPQSGVVDLTGPAAQANAPATTDAG